MTERKDIPSLGEVIVPDKKGIPRTKPVRFSRGVQWAGEFIVSSGKLVPPKPAEDARIALPGVVEPPFSSAHISVGKNGARLLG